MRKIRRTNITKYFKLSYVSLIFMRFSHITLTWWQWDHIDSVPFQIKSIKSLHNWRSNWWMYINIRSNIITSSFSKVSYKLYSKFTVYSLGSFRENKINNKILENLILKISFYIGLIVYSRRPGFLQSDIRRFSHHHSITISNLCNL